MLKQDKEDSKRPYVLVVEERYVRHIAVWAENVFEAMEKAEELHGAGEIDTTLDHYAGHTIQRFPGKATDMLMSLIPHYGKDEEND